jgi:RNA polymerase subunit RPABC4/transcription elongation factor Spt4
MIFIGGVAPKTTIIDQTPRLCPVCGLAQARLQRVDHYLSIFFIPVFRVQKGETFIFCNRCDQPVFDATNDAANEEHHFSRSCSTCGRALAEDHRFCPYCGQPRQ